MVMNFWEAQRRARVRTTIYITLFVALTLFVAALVEVALRYFAEDNYDPPAPIIGLLFLAITFGVALFNYGMYREQGGSYVAESIGARPADPSDPREKQLLNIVQEIAVATTLPMPKVFVIPADEINAFAAGLTHENAAIAITEGALDRLNREEIQGVIAHEFGHVSNGDMVIGLRLAAMVMGFYIALYIGLRLIQVSRFRSRDGNGKGVNPVLLAALMLMIAGAVTWFFGSILKATVSRQREYLADASSVQYTRNPQGIASALRKIAKDSRRDMPKTGAAFSHMYLEDHASIFATHPPIGKRIAAIEGKAYIPEE